MQLCGFLVLYVSVINIVLFQFDARFIGVRESKYSAHVIGLLNIAPELHIVPVLYFVTQQVLVKCVGTFMMCFRTKFTYLTPTFSYCQGRELL